MAAAATVRVAEGMVMAVVLTVAAARARAAAAMVVEGRAMVAAVMVLVVLVRVVRSATGIEARGGEEGGALVGVGGLLASWPSLEISARRTDGSVCTYRWSWLGKRRRWWQR